MFSRTIFVSDTHGFTQPWMTLFTDLGICDETGKWIAEDTQLIHVGDHVDRGDDSVGMYRMVKRWQEQTDASTVIRLIGNHDFQYFGGPDCGKERAVEYISDELAADALSGNWKFAHVFETGKSKYLIVHAGLSGQWDRLHEIDIDEACCLINAAGYQVLREKEYNGIVSGIGPSRGGLSWELPGVTWCDYYSDLVPTEDNIVHHQIVGHSIQPGISLSPQGKVWALNVMYAHAQALIFDHAEGFFHRSAIYIPATSSVEDAVLSYAATSNEFDVIRTPFESYL